MKNDLAVDGGFEDGALGLEFVAQQVGIDEVAVVADGDLAAGAVGDDGLGVFEGAGAGGRIADMADGAGAGQFGEFLFVEDLGDKAHAVMALELAFLVAGDDDPGAFLAAVLQGIEPEKGDFGRVRMAEDGKHAALILRTVLKNVACLGG